MQLNLGLVDFFQVHVDFIHFLFVQGDVDQAEKLNFLVLRLHLFIVFIDVLLELSVEVALDNVFVV